MSAVLGCTYSGDAFIMGLLVVAFLLLAACHAFVPYDSSESR